MGMRRSVTGAEGNWIEMQKETFKNWVNANLKVRGLEVADLETGFEDGVKLVNLFEVVSKKDLGRYAKNPKFANQKLENCALVLKAMEADGIKIVSIDSDHIVSGNLKMILGLIWLLILHYQIGGGEEKTIKIALKKLLLTWLQHVIPEQRITNLTTDWNSGIALCNLVEVMKPGLCPEYKYMRSEDDEENLAKGLRIAEDLLGIPQIMSPENMARRDVDELSMMTYLSYFTQDNGVGEHWTLKLVNDWNPKIGASNFNTDWNNGRALSTLVESCAPGLIPNYPNLEAGSDVDHCRVAMDVADSRLGVPQIISPEEMANPSIPELAVMAYVVQFTKVQIRVRPADKFKLSGPGIVEPQAGKMNEFYVRCEDDYPMDELKVEVTGPNGPVNVTLVETSQSISTYRYKVETPGNYIISAKYRNSHIPRSPITTTAHQDLNNVKVNGDGLENPHLNEPSEFTVNVGTKNARVNVDVEGPGGTHTPATVIDNGDGTYTIRYTPRQIGSHRVYININNQSLPGGAIETTVTDPNAVEVTSQQYQADKQLYAEVNERIGIAVDTRHSGEGSLTAETFGPSNRVVPTEVIKESEGNYTVSFTPVKIGEYKTNVYWSNRPIQGSPFIVWASDPNKVVAHGDGLIQARIHEAASFEVGTEGAGPGKITARAENERGEEVPVAVKQINDKKWECMFTPTDVGEYKVFIEFNNAAVPRSPFTVLIGNPREAVVVVATEKVVRTTTTCSMRVNLGRDAGRGELSCNVTGPDGKQLPSEVTPVQGGKEISFVPRKPGRHQVNIYYAGVLLSGCPYVVNVQGDDTPVNATKVVVSGSGKSSGLVNDVSRVQVDASRAGPGHLSATVQGLKHDVVVSIRDHHDGTYELTYTPPTPGAYIMNIKWNDEHVPGSPYKITVQSRADAASVVLEGEGIKEGTVGQPIQFTLNGRRAGPGQLSCRCRAPSGIMTYVGIHDNKDGTYTVDLNATEPGLHTVEVEWDGQPIPGSPFLVRIMQAPDVKKVRAHGSGLESGLINSFQGVFKVETKGAGPGTLKIRIHGPKGAFKVEMSRDHPKDRTINVKYNPTEPGIYTANVFWSDEHVQGSPFEIFVAQDAEHLRKWENNREHIHQQEGLMNGH